MYNDICKLTRTWTFFFGGQGLEISFPINLDKVVPIVIYSTYIIVFEKNIYYIWKYRDSLIPISLFLERFNLDASTY